MSDPVEPVSGSESTPSVDEATPGKSGKPEKPKREFLGRTTRLYHKLHLPPVKSRLGILMIVLIVAGIGSVITLVGLKAASYSESSSFCGKCHAMGPELQAYRASAHSELPCADCHVAPGIMGFAKAKIKGTQQLIEVITGSFPKPIPPPDHSELPPVTDTCLKCHSLDSITRNGGPIQLVLRPHFLTDKKNTGQMVAVVMRPQGMGNATDSDTSINQGKGVHWHVVQNVTYLSNDPKTQTIDYVNVTNADGSRTQYISASAIQLSNNVLPTIVKMRNSETNHTMTCLDCHNRAGHGAPSPSQALDSALAGGSISRKLPYIKRNAMALLDRDFNTIDAAHTAISGLQFWYQKNYPAIAKQYQSQLTSSIAEIQTIYSGLATPEMKVYSTTYPDNLGHQKSPGCFRCHDGGHYKVVNGAVSTQVIPSTCSTCHTFPQVGGQVTSLMLAGKPASHNNSLWVFGHKSAAAAVASARNASIQHEKASVDPAGTTCGTCHEKSYCEACHKSGAINVSHDAMKYNHAAVIRSVGGTTACATCHQTATCAQCHKGNVLKGVLN
jgi:nitrate/TMAO reductase-like tetraheme cytochrome c subunit